MGIIYRNGYPTPIMRRDEVNYLKTNASLHEIYSTQHYAKEYGRAFTPVTIVKKGEYAGTSFVDYLQPCFDYPMGACTYYTGLDSVKWFHFDGQREIFVKDYKTATSIRTNNYVMDPKSELGYTSSSTPDLILGFYNDDTTKIKGANYGIVDQNLSIAGGKGQEVLWWIDSTNRWARAGRGKKMTFFQIDQPFISKMYFHTNMIVGCRNCEPVKLLRPTIDSVRTEPLIDWDNICTKKLYLGKDRDCSYYWLTTDGYFNEPYANSNSYGCLPRELIAINYKTEYSGTDGEEIICIPFYCETSISTRVAKKYNSTGINT